VILTRNKIVTGAEQAAQALGGRSLADILNNIRNTIVFAM
jgi:hypothetical protein